MQEEKHPHAGKEKTLSALLHLGESGILKNRTRSTPPDAGRRISGRIMMKRVVALLLAVVLMTVCFVPAALADDAPSREDMRGHGDIAVPKQDSWLSAYETRYVCASGGVAAFLFKAPALDSEKFDAILEGTELTLLAEENGFYLIKTADRRLVWIGKGQTAEDTSLLESLPEMEDSCWIYSCGEGERNTFAVKFNGKWADFYRQSDGAHIKQSWVLSMRRVLLNGQYFIWDGEQFTSRDEYKTPGGKIRYTITPDTEGLYEKLAG